jgi:hypothetical protein
VLAHFEAPVGTRNCAIEDLQEWGREARNQYALLTDLN